MCIAGFWDAVAQHCRAASLAEILGDAVRKLEAGEFVEQGGRGLVSGRQESGGEEESARQVSAGVTGAEVGGYWEGIGGECYVVSGIATQAGGFDGFRVARHD